MTDGAEGTRACRVHLYIHTLRTRALMASLRDPHPLSLALSLPLSRVRARALSLALALRTPPSHRLEQLLQRLEPREIGLVPPSCLQRFARARTLPCVYTQTSTYQVCTEN